jgi:ubiquinone/menaquinone biosynthesis C-methylase UbiE
MSWSYSIIRTLLPNYKSGHTRYVEIVKHLFKDGCRWLDAGGGRRVFPDEYDGEQELISRASLVVVCDVDESSLRDHVSVSHRVCSNLDQTPFASRSFDLITCGMVVEHLADPTKSIVELGRILDAHGKLVIHTVNLCGYPTLIAIASKWLPFRTQLIAAITGREVQDIFPTHYRCNTERRMRDCVALAGLQIEEIHHLSAGILFARFWPLTIVECLWVRITNLDALSRLRGQLLVIASKQPACEDAPVEQLHRTELAK